MDNLCLHSPVTLQIDLVLDNSIEEHIQILSKQTHQSAFNMCVGIFEQILMNNLDSLIDAATNKIEKAKLLTRAYYLFGYIDKTKRDVSGVIFSTPAPSQLVKYWTPEDVSPF